MHLFMFYVMEILAEPRKNIDEEGHPGRSAPWCVENSSLLIMSLFDQITNFENV